MLPNITTLLPYILTLFFGSAFIYLLFRNKQLEKQIIELHRPELAVQQSQSLLATAQTNAQQIMTQAQMEALKTETSAEMTNKLIQNQLLQFEAEYQKRFEDSMAQLSKDFQAHLVSSEGNYQNFLKTIEEHSNALSTEIQTLTKTKINEVLLNFEQNLATFMATSQEKSIQAVELELRSTRGLIDTYKQEQFKLIDENIVAVLERTMSLVLNQKLTLKDQLDLVFDSLEKAKVEKFFA